MPLGRFSSARQALDSYGPLLTETDKSRLERDVVWFGCCFVEVKYDGDLLVSARRVEPEEF